VNVVVVLVVVLVDQWSQCRLVPVVDGGIVVGVVETVVDVVVGGLVTLVDVRLVVDVELSVGGVIVTSGTHATILKLYIGLGLMKVMRILLPDTVGRTTIVDEVNNSLKTVVTVVPSSTTICRITVPRLPVDDMSTSMIW
jgi:hypothetical protein